MTRVQALALADFGIRVDSVSLGWTWSNVIREFGGDDRAKADGVAGRSTVAFDAVYETIEEVLLYKNTAFLINTMRCWG